MQARQRNLARRSLTWMCFSLQPQETVRLGNEYGKTFYLFLSSYLPSTFSVICPVSCALVLSCTEAELHPFTRRPSGVYCNSRTGSGLHSELYFLPSPCFYEGGWLITVFAKVGHILSYLNSVHSFTSDFSQTLPCTFRSNKSYLSSRFSNQSLTCKSRFPIFSTCLAHLILLY
jgi:hypothetical protein